MMADSASSETYMIKRTPIEAQRLDDQHTILLKASGGLLHPPSIDFSSLRSILDCGTGTTVWARHVIAGGGGEDTRQRFQLRPGCVVDVCDVTDRQVPKSLPKGIHEFFTYDVMQPFPKERRGRYDLIHQRLLLGAVSGGRWPQVIANLKKGLAPGGFLVLHETGPEMECPGDPEVIARYNGLADELLSSQGHHSRLPDELESLVRAPGFVDVEAIHFPWPIGPAGAHLGDSYVVDSVPNIEAIIGPTGAYGMLAERLQGKVRGLPDAQEAKAILGAAVGEVRRVGGSFRMVVVTGKKSE